jgi:hypothetical protein
MIQEYSEYLLKAASLSRETSDTFKGIQFDEISQPIELFALQSIAMCDSHCGASALLLKNDFAAEAVGALRPIQELLFDIHWLLQPETREERLDRIYRLQADPYARWDKETKIIAAKYSPEKAKEFRGPLDDILAENPQLTETNADGTTHFKSMNASVADRMGEKLRPLYYHIFMYGSLFVHPTPTNKNLYLERIGFEMNAQALEESLKQFIAYSLLSVKFILGYTEGILGSFSPSGAKQRVRGFTEMANIVNNANKEYFRVSELNHDGRNCC